MNTQLLQKQDHERDILVAHEVNADVRYGSRLFIDHHRAGAMVDIKSWGTADSVYEDVTAQLIGYGMQQGMAHNYTRGLVDYALDNLHEFRSEHSANIIALRVTVAETNPDPQFETGPVATFRLNGLSRQAEMASASGQNVRFTASGTATTSSDRSSVEKVWQGVKEWSVWGKMEAPDKSELAGRTPALIAAALAQMADGELTPAEAASLQGKLEALAQEGLIAPELADIVRAVETMRAMMDGGMAVDASMAQPQALAEYIAGLIEQGLENGNLPPELARQVMESIASFSDAYGLEQVFSTEMMLSLNAAVEWTAVTQALAEVLPHLSAEGRAAIDAMLEGGEVPAREVLAEQIAAISEIIAQADLPEGVAEYAAVIEKSSAVLQEIAQSQIDPAVAMAEMSAAPTSIDLSSLSAIEIQQIIASMDGVEPADLSPEQAEVLQAIQDAMGTVDLTSATPAQIEAVLKGADVSDVIAPAALVAGVASSTPGFSPITTGGSVSAGSAPTAFVASNTNTPASERPVHTPAPDKSTQVVAPVVQEQKNDIAPVKDELQKTFPDGDKKPDEPTKPKPTENKKPDIVIVPIDVDNNPVQDKVTPEDPTNVSLDTPGGGGADGPVADVPDDIVPVPEKKDGCEPGLCKCFKDNAGNNDRDTAFEPTQNPKVLANGLVFAVHEDGSVQVGDKVFSKEEAKEIIERDRAAADRIMKDVDRNVITENDMKAYLPSGGNGNDLKDTFHVCGAGCDHTKAASPPKSIAALKAKVGEAIVGTDRRKIDMKDLLQSASSKYGGWDNKPSGP